MTTRILVVFCFSSLLWAGIEDYTSIWMDEGGQFGVIVGTNGTILHYNGSEWNPVFSPTSQDLFDVHGLAPDDAVASGAGVILHWDGIQWTVLVDQPGANYTPVLLTSNRVWYGIPDSQFPIVGRCDRMGQGCLGLVAQTGSVLELREESGGTLTLIGVLGDIYRIDEALTQTPIYDHPVGMSMEFTAATVVSSQARGGIIEAFGANATGVHRFDIDAWTQAAALTDDVYRMRHSTCPGVPARGVGRTGPGNGFLMNIAPPNVNLEMVPGADGLGISDIGESGQSFGIFDEVMRKDTHLVGDQEFNFTSGLCVVIPPNWSGSGPGGANIANFIDSLGTCQGN